MGDGGWRSNPRLNANNSIAWQSGWGNNQSELAFEGYVPDPTVGFGFTGGAGGGPSNCAVQNSSGHCVAGFPKPAFQKALPGKYRQVPDIAWLADPYTGVVIAISVPGQVPEEVWQVWGGTSVACPMFSALWAIANQEAGAPLGQAAQYVYSLPAEAVTDIVPVSSPGNVKASIKDSTGTNRYTPAEVLGGATPATPAKFVSAIWDYPYDDVNCAGSLVRNRLLRLAHQRARRNHVHQPNRAAYKGRLGQCNRGRNAERESVRGCLQTRTCGQVGGTARTSPPLPVRVARPYFLGHFRVKQRCSSFSLL